MYFIDTHTHLFSEAFNEDRDKVVERALRAGVNYLLLPNIDLDSISQMYQLCAQYPENCFPMMGLHPGSVNENWKKDLAVIEEHLFSKSHVAVGEIGMDLYWDKSYKEEQREAFQIQVQWAKELKLPVVIHAREAFDEIFEVINEMNDENLKGVFHCFTGNIDQAKHILNYGGFKLGIGGVVTYKNSGLAEVLKEIPIESLVLETDSPYLPPNPHRGKRNESSYLLYIAEKIAEIYTLPLMQIAEITSKNARDVFEIHPLINEEHLSINGLGTD